MSLDGCVDLCFSNDHFGTVVWFDIIKTKIIKPEEQKSRDTVTSGKIRTAKDK